MGNVRNAENRVCELKLLIKELGRLRSLRDPMADLAGDLTPPQMHSMMWLFEEGPLPLSTVAQRVRCSAPTITGVIDRLERLGHVVRMRDTKDRRVVLVKLTAQGTRIAKKLDAAFSKHLVHFFDAMTASDGDTLLSILRRVVDAYRSRVKEAS